MVNVTFSIPQELKQKMDQFDEINWSAVARKAFDQKISDLEFMKKFTAQSTMTAKDALDLGRKAKKGIAKRHGI